VVKSGFHIFAIKPESDRVVVVKTGFHRFAIKPGSRRVVVVKTQSCIKRSHLGQIETGLI
jgi:microcystin degradation protein MlrC